MTLRKREGTGNWKRKALDRTLWRTRFASVYGIVARRASKWMSSFQWRTWPHTSPLHPVLHKSSRLFQIYERFRVIHIRVIHFLYFVFNYINCELQSPASPFPASSPTPKSYFTNVPNEVPNEDKTDGQNSEPLSGDPRMKLIVHIIDFYAPKSTE